MKQGSAICTLILQFQVNLLGYEYRPFLCAHHIGILSALYSVNLVSTQRMHAIFCVCVCLCVCVCVCVCGRAGKLTKAINFTHSLSKESCFIFWITNVEG